MVENIIFVMVSRNPSDPASSESLSSHKSGSSRNLSIGFPSNTFPGGCGKCLRIALKTLRSLTNPVFCHKNMHSQTEDLKTE